MALTTMPRPATRPRDSTAVTMKVFVYPGPGKKALEERPKPEITAATDAIVNIVKTTICGTDLHILKGDVPTCQPGRILGHEGVGIVDKVGPAVTVFKPGDRPLISCVSACGKCVIAGNRCTTGGWILGNSIDGTQAEFVRTPYADTSLYPIPEGADARTKSGSPPGTPVGPQHFHRHTIGRHRHHTDAVQVRRLSQDRPQAPDYPSLQARQHPRRYDNFGNAAKTKALKVIIEA
jgi:hypothetical protein